MDAERSPLLVGLCTYSSIGRVHYCEFAFLPSPSQAPPSQPLTEARMPSTIVRRTSGPAFFAPGTTDLRPDLDMMNQVEAVNRAHRVGMYEHLCRCYAQTITTPQHKRVFLISLLSESRRFLRERECYNPELEARLTEKVKYIKTTPAKDAEDSFQDILKEILSWNVFRQPPGVSITDIHKRLN